MLIDAVNNNEFAAPSTDSSIELVESTVTTKRCTPSIPLGIVKFTVRLIVAPAAIVCTTVGAATVRSLPITRSSESATRSPRNPVAAPLPRLRTT